MWLRETRLTVMAVYFTNSVIALLQQSSTPFCSTAAQGRLVLCGDAYPVSIHIVALLLVLLQQSPQWHFLGGICWH